MTVKIENLNEDQKKAFQEFFFQIQDLSHMGSSRWVCFFADGDGNLKPKITINGEKPKHTGVDCWANYECRIDQDMF